MTDDGSAKNGSPGDEVVYGHRMGNKPALFYIGSGSERRARTLTYRGALWQNFVEAHGGVTRVEVVIIERHHCPARARLREMELVKRHQPDTNRFGRSSMPPAILDGRPKASIKRCDCGAPDCYGAELTARSKRTFGGHDGVYFAASEDGLFKSLPLSSPLGEKYGYHD